MSTFKTVIARTKCSKRVILICPGDLVLTMLNENAFVGTSNCVLRVVHTRAILFFDINVGSDRIVPTVSDFKFSLCVNDDSFI